MSSDLKGDHSVSYFLKTVLRNYNQNQFEKKVSAVDERSGTKPHVLAFKDSNNVDQYRWIAEDIKKMYDDERKLFAPNAKCTLYGTSDVVESMAYDKSTDILHAITNQGRSDFVGLNRINNTTQGSDRAISAAGGLVAED